MLLEHGLQHLDLHEITTSRSAVTQTIAADLYDRDATAAVRGRVGLVEATDG